MNNTFQHCQEKKIEHYASMANLMLTMSLGAMAFMFTLLDKIPAESVQFASSNLFLASFFTFFLSGGFAFLGMTSRLEELRANADYARLLEANPDQKRLLELQRTMAQNADRRTRRYFLIQMITFGFALYFLSSVLIDANRSKLYPQKTSIQAPVVPRVVRKP